MIEDKAEWGKDLTRREKADTVGCFNFVKNQNGSPGRTRTADPVINSHLLYRLSYRGRCWKRAGIVGRNRGRVKAKSGVLGAIDGVIVAVF